MFRLREIRKSRKVTQQELAEYLNVTQATLSGWETEKFEIDNTNLKKCANYFDVSIDYLLGNSFDSSEIKMARAAIKDLYSQSDIPISEIEEKTGASYSTFRSWLDGYGDYFNSRLSILARLFNVSVESLLGKEASIPVSDVVMVPIYGKVAAGIGMFADDEIIGEQPVFSALVKNIGECFCLKVSGDSMLPRIQDGDIILVRKQPSVDSGSYAVVLIDDENGVVKKVTYDSDSVTLVSINPNYPPRTFSGADLQRLTVLGEVIQIISTLK